MRAPSTLDVANATRLAYLAALAAVEAPERQSRNAECARVRWSLINEVREALDDAGFDWRTACRAVAKVTLAKEPA